MPANNQFHHQSYPSLPEFRPALMNLKSDMAVNFDFGRLHREHRVSRVLLVHGTLVGDDPFGVSDALNSVSEMLPLVAGPIEKMAESIRQQT